ncbi:pentapeptide repeat-containing protein [Paenibacillus sp. OSY-SE]|uniref:pentapeptide repeat-containing protein n=1 Tax=Paenibacillus sp. OSY-SE TaxID=1196323 RepID=UPI0003133E45|nr:pentapeptide repeat-containing protein [Paenibacillus sp. OSY-SE]
MDKAESIAHFREQIVWQERANMQLVLERDYQLHKEWLASEFVASFQHICRQIRDAQARGEKGPIGYITFSMLRTELMEGRYIYRVEAMDAGWVFDRNPYVLQYDAGWAFQHLDTFRSKLIEGSRIYGGRASVPIIEQMMLAESIAIHRYIVALARFALPQAVELEEYRDIATEPVFEIRVGEYMDLSEVVFKQDAREQDSEFILAWLDDREDGEHAYELFRNVDLSAGDYRGIDFRYSEFNHCNLSHGSLQDSVLIDTRWSGSGLTGADFSRSQIHGAEFRDCDLKGAIFQYAEGANGWKDARFLNLPGLSALCFAGSDLEGADFTGASYMERICPMRTWRTPCLTVRI